MYLNTRRINLKSKLETKEVSEFLKDFQLNYEDVDYTIVIEENSKIIATCSKKGNIIKCFAIDEEYQGQGLASTLITDVRNKLFDEGVYHSFIFTKPRNNYLFQGLGYKLIVSTEKVSLLEIGNVDIRSSLNNIRQKYGIESSEEYAALIMNCNPFTLGHRYIIERAAKENKNVIVFVVEEERSVFPFSVRFQLIKDGIKDLNNVKVIPGGEYIISSATFPNYFLRKDDDILKEYTMVDGKVFGEYFCSEFNIKKRYLGTEPYCNVTNTYNETLQEVLPSYGVKVELIERKNEDNLVISASRVRELLKIGDMEGIKSLVPKTTYNFLLSEAAKDIINNIKVNELKH